jgi:RNA polymerase sigma-70 factor (ECF subfamily)
VPYLRGVIGAPGDWRMTPTVANGQPAAVVHHRGAPFCVVVLTTTPAGIARITLFGDPRVVARFSSHVLAP